MGEKCYGKRGAKIRKEGEKQRKTRRHKIENKNKEEKKKGESPLGSDDLFFSKMWSFFF